MSPLSLAEQFNLKHEEGLRLHKCWPWFLVLGILVIVAGMIAIALPFLATLTSVLIFGFLLLAGGFVEIVNAFLAHSWRGFFLHLLAGLLHIVVGLLMIDRPLLAAEVLTLILAVAFLVGGTVRIIIALVDRFPDWGWVLLNGIITLLLGIMIWKQWPESSIWVIGLFVGIDLIFSGWTWVTLGLLVKSLSPQSPHAEPRAPSSVQPGNV